jgi:hypothetical protein
MTLFGSKQLKTVKFMKKGQYYILLISFGGCWVRDRVVQKTRKSDRVAQYNLVTMNLENPDDQSMLFAGEPLSCMYSFKEDLLDKATNHNISELKHSHFPHAFENSPHRGSFFFTPNSPKPLRFDLAPDSSHPLHHTISHPSRHTISRKLNLE